MYYYLCEALNAEGRIDDAIAEWRVAISRIPTEPAFQFSLRTLLIATTLVAVVLRGRPKPIYDHDHRRTFVQQAKGLRSSGRQQSGQCLHRRGDLDGNGVTDLAVANRNGLNGLGDETGTVDILFMNVHGGVKSTQRIDASNDGPPNRHFSDEFGTSVTALGDLDGDGITELAVGGIDREYGCVDVLFMNRDGTLKSYQQIGNNLGGGPKLDKWDGFGYAMAAVGDMDGDGVADLAVGAYGDSYDGAAKGAVYVLFLNADGTVKSSQKINDENGGGPALERRDCFGASLASLGDIDGDGVTDLAVGAYNDYLDDPRSNYRGVVHVLLMNSNGTVKAASKIGDGIGGGPPLVDDNDFGWSITSLGDLDGDGINDIAVGAPGSSGGDERDGGSLYVMLLNTNGTVKTKWQIASHQNGGPVLNKYSNFGRALASPDDIDGDGVVDLAVLASGYEPDIPPVLYTLFLRPATPDFGDAPDTGPGTGHGNYQTQIEDNGPSHIIVNGLRLGGRVDSDTGELQNIDATADNGDRVWNGDEDGLESPVGDLQLTVGTAPAIHLWATNTTESDATLYGWSISMRTVFSTTRLSGRR